VIGSVLANSGCRLRLLLVHALDKKIWSVGSNPATRPFNIAYVWIVVRTAFIVVCYFDIILSLTPI
jgi:hypothetical protein